jgi:hypothetical protein
MSTVFDAEKKSDYKAPDNFFEDVVMKGEPTAQRKLDNITRRMPWILLVTFAIGFIVGVLFF